MRLLVLKNAHRVAHVVAPVLAPVSVVAASILVSVAAAAAAADAAATRMGPFGLMSSWKGERRPSFCRAAIILMRERNLSPFLYP